MIVLAFFTSSTTPGSWLIRRVTGEDCSHCAIFIPGQGVYHATAPKSQLLSFEEFTKNHHVVHCLAFEKTKEEVDLLTQKLKTMLGKPYDYLTFFKLGLRLLFPRLKDKVDVRVLANTYICTELVSAALLGQEDPLITPHKLFDKLAHVLPQEHVLY